MSPRQPCPCGSGRRYKACHGGGSRRPFVARSFAGLPGECDWVALREIVPAATAPLRLRSELQVEREVQVCTVLPMALPAMVRPDGAVWLGLQVHHNFGDVSRDLAAALERALDADPGAQIAMLSDPGPGPRLQDLVDPEAPFPVQVHDGYDFWLSGLDDPTGQIAASLESANRAASPTRRIDGVEAAYWTRLGEREFLRWVLPHHEDQLLDALARLHVGGGDSLGPGRLIGSFRAHGLLVPVWELPPGTGADELAEQAAQLERRLDRALGDRSRLTPAERAARNGLANRQLTLR